MRSGVFALLCVAVPALASPPELKIEYEALRPSDAQLRPNQQFGWSVDSESEIVAVGAPRAYDTDMWSPTGGAYVLDHLGDGWRETRLVPSDAQVQDRVGESIAVLGDHMLVGSYHHNGVGLESGAVWTYHRTESGWIEEVKLIGSDVGEYAWFGFDMAAEGDQALITSPQYNSALHVGAGVVYAFRHDGTQWMQTQKLTASDGEIDDRFGLGVDLSGDIAVIGSAAHWSPLWRGVAYVFRYDGAQWVEEAQLAPDVSGSGFGQADAISISGDRILLGAEGDRTRGSAAGAAYVFRYDGLQWIEETRLYASDGAAGDAFGYTVALSGDVALVGARSSAAADGSTGSVYLFRFQDGSWVELGKLAPPDRAEHDGIGTDLRFQAGSGAIGAQNKVYRVEIFRTLGLDIRPNDAENHIDPISVLGVPVAVLGSRGFDVNDVDWESLRFGPARARAIGARPTSLRDVDRDGSKDLLSRYSQREIGLTLGDQTTCIRGGLPEAGIGFRGCDSVEIATGCGVGFEAALMVPAITWLGRRGRSRTGRLPATFEALRPPCD